MTIVESENSLRVVGLSVHYSGLRALDSVSISVNSGNILGLIGPNGAGKSTLVNALTGFQNYSGQCFLNGVDTTGWSSPRLSRAGIRRTFQNIRLIKEMSVRENIEVAAIGIGLNSRDARLQSNDLLEWFKLDSYADLPAGSLPYGLGRVLGVARALVSNPKFIFLDEPAAGLDETEVDTLITQLRPLPERFKCCLIVIEHDMRLITNLCDQIQVLNYGETLFLGSVAEASNDPAVMEAYLGEPSSA